MAQSHRNPGGSPARQKSPPSRESTQDDTPRYRDSSEYREIERARYRNKAFRGKMEEGDEGQGEWESSARSW
ncbi:MAG: hypothetical protein JWP69_780 [Flaviaesturariibacter sp.]|nr:hypothetical protein [Flaviaesturariibacter sp.]